MLRFLPFDILPDTNRCQCLFEKGRTLALVGKHPQAGHNFAHALTLLQRAPHLASPQHLTRVFAGLATSLINQKRPTQLRITSAML